MASQPQTHNTGRRVSRSQFDAQVQFRAGTRRAQVQVSDISQYGARVKGVFLARIDDRFWIKIANLESIEARVVWAEEFEFGCEFTKPLNATILEAILRAA